MHLNHFDLYLILLIINSLQFILKKVSLQCLLWVMKLLEYYIGTLCLNFELDSVFLLFVNNFIRFKFIAGNIKFYTKLRTLVFLKIA